MFARSYKFWTPIEVFRGRPFLSQKQPILSRKLHIIVWCTAHWLEQCYIWRLKKMFIVSFKLHRKCYPLSVCTPLFSLKQLNVLFVYVSPPQATAEANNLAAVSKSRDLYNESMEAVSSYLFVSSYLLVICFAPHPSWILYCHYVLQVSARPATFVEAPAVIDRSAARRLLVPRY